MNNPLFNKKKANGFDAPVGNPKKHYDGFYPEAIGGGWNPSDGNDLAGEYSKQVGGYFQQNIPTDKVKNFINDVMRNGEEPAPKLKGEDAKTLKKLVQGAMKPGVRRSKIAEIDDSYYEDKELTWAILDNIEEVKNNLVWTMEQVQSAQQENDPLSAEKHIEEYARFYAQAKALIEEYPVARNWAQKHMLHLPNPKNVGQATNQLKKERSKGIRDAVNDYKDAPKKDRKIRGVPKFDNADQIRLHGLGVSASQKLAWDTAVSKGLLQFASNRYSFGKNASEEIRTGFKPLVAAVNCRLNRQHIPKRASAHEAAIKVIAKKLSVARTQMDGLDRLAKVAAGATHVVHDDTMIRVMKGAHIIEEIPVKKEAALLAKKMARNYGISQVVFEHELSIVAASNYEQMFTQLEQIAPELKPKIDKEIQWAKEHLKKSNRIVWWLKWFRLALVASALSAQPANDQLIAFQTKATRGMNVVEAPSLAEVAALHQKLDHFYSLPIPTLQSFEPRNSDPDSVLREFNSLESQWQEERKGTLSPRSEDTIFMDFNNGWAWWLLPRAACSDESDAMGHCGNSPAAGRNDRTILSLRQSKKVGTKEVWEPHLTFILHTDGETPDSGYLGEMKGKGNAKPVARYHPYIMALLKDHRIKGILGGGYLPSHNFSFSDLSTEQQEEVRKANPEGAFTFQEYMKRENVSLTEMAERFSMEGVEFEMPDVGTCVSIRRWYDIDEFCDSNGDDSIKELASCVGGDMSLFVDDMLSKINPIPAVFTNIGKQINIEFSEHRVNLESRDIVSEVNSAIREINDRGESELRKGLEKALLRGYGYSYDSLKDMLESAVLESTDAAGDGVTGEITIAKNGDVVYYLTAQQLMDLAQNQPEGEDVEWASLYPMGFSDSGMDEPQEALNTLEDEFKVQGVNPRRLEDYGQQRLFKRPTDAEARRDGIRVSRLLRKRATKPKCPHCGSTKYGLMPTDFETAKCDECGKNWEMGIVPGINDPSDNGKYGTATANTIVPSMLVMSALTDMTAAVEKKAWEGELFQYFSLTFSIEEADRILATTPHEEQVAPKEFLERFVGKTEVGESMEPDTGTGTINWLSDTTVDKSHLPNVDHFKPGIVAVITHKANKRYPTEVSQAILIDGNHRAKKALILGEEFKVCVLTPEESWKCLVAGKTSPQWLKNYVNPTAKARKK